MQGGSDLGFLLESVIMGLWRSMARPPPSRMLEEDEEEEPCSMLRDIAVAACDAQNISIPFIFRERESG